jgi:hypothetical protein
VIADYPDTATLDERFVPVVDKRAPLQTAGIWVVLRSRLTTT